MANTEEYKTIAGYGLVFTLKHILVGAHGVALSLHNTARRGEVVFDAHLATVLSLEGDKIAVINTYLADVEMLNAFFGSGTVLAGRQPRQGRKRLAHGVSRGKASAQCQPRQGRKKHGGAFSGQADVLSYAPAGAGPFGEFTHG